LALLASLTDGEVSRILGENSGILKNYPHYSNERLLKEIAEARQRGYGLVKSYLSEDVWTLGFPIRNPQGQCIAGISIATISARLTNGREKFIADSVREAVREAEGGLAAM
jgi:DNA-binding IclR family transcriptional regulator